MRTLSFKSLKLCSLLFILATCMASPMIAGDREGRDNQRDDEYDLYDRNRDQRDFNPYDFPEDEQAECSRCKMRQQQNNDSRDYRR